MAISHVLHLLALLSFVLAAVGVNARVNLVALGLAFWIATQL